MQQFYKSYIAIKLPSSLNCSITHTDLIKKIMETIIMHIYLNKYIPMAKLLRANILLDFLHLTFTC